MSSIVLHRGEVFGKYRIVSLLGRGGAGSVYIAEDQTLGREVALKVLDRTLTRIGSFEEALRQEARIVASIEHPHIVRIHSLERVGDDLAIDMAYMRGGSLAEGLLSGRFPTLNMLAAIQETLSALTCCHASGVVHRDVKPANILFDEHGLSHLSDFGLAKLLLTRHGEYMASSISTEYFVGTPRYAPPEAWDNADATPAWDVYSVGMILYEAITGRPAYDAQAPLSYVKQLLERPAPAIDPDASNVSRELADAVAAMLEHDPLNRPQDAGEAFDRLRAVPEYSIIEAATLTPHTPLSGTTRLKRERRAKRFKWKQYRPLAVGMGYMLAILLAGSAIFLGGRMLWNRSESERGPRAYDTTAVGSGTVAKGQLVAFPGESLYETLEVNSEGSAIWMLKGAADGNDATRYQGHWAEYDDSNARLFRHGVISGTGRTEPDGREVMSLVFVCLQDGSRREQSFLKSPTSSGHSDEYLHNFLTNDFVQPLVFGELMPRRLAWAEQLEQHCLLTPEGLVSVPLSPESSVKVDGRLDDALWKDATYMHEGRVANVADPSSALLLRYTDEALYVGVKFSKPESGTRTTLAILNQFGVPLSSSAQWFASFDNGHLVEAHHRHATEESPWKCDWISAAAKVPPGWEMEVRIPFKNVDEPLRPEAEQRWRLSCSVDEAPSGRTVARWGGDGEHVEDGMVIAFRPGDAP